MSPDCLFDLLTYSERKSEFIPVDQQALFRLVLDQTRSEPPINLSAEQSCELLAKLKHACASKLLRELQAQVIAAWLNAQPSPLRAR